MKFTKEELLKQNTLLIESEINHMDVENLSTILSRDSDNATIILSNITEGNFSDAVKMKNVLFNTNRRINIVCDGIINLTGIVPLISAKSILCAAKENTTFVIDTNHYFDSYLIPEERNEAMSFLKKLFIKYSNLHEIELFYILNQKNTMNVETAYKYGFINDIYRSKTIGNIYNLNSIQKFKKDSAITFERGIRENLKSSAVNSLIKVSDN